MSAMNEFAEVRSLCPFVPWFSGAVVGLGGAWHRGCQPQVLSGRTAVTHRKASAIIRISARREA